MAFVQGFVVQDFNIYLPYWASWTTQRCFGMSVGRRLRPNGDGGGSIKLLWMPINVNKCLLDLACNQLISIHLNVEFMEVSTLLPGDPSVLMTRPVGTNTAPDWID